MCVLQNTNREHTPFYFFFKPCPCVVSQVPAVASRAKVEMGRGDKRTKKGKRKAGSFGNSRPRNSKIRIQREGAGADLGAREPVILEEMPQPVAAEEVVEPVVEEEPAAVEEAAPAMSPKELMAALKDLRAELPRADLKECKAAIEASNGDVESAKAALLAEKGAEWEAAEAAQKASIKEGTAAAMDLRDAKAQKKFEKEEAKKAAEPVAEAAEEPAAVAEPEAAPAMSPKELMAALKDLRAELPRADSRSARRRSRPPTVTLRRAKDGSPRREGRRVGGGGGRSEGVNQGGYCCRMDLRDAKAQKKFEKEEAKKEAEPAAPVDEAAARACC